MENSVFDKLYNEDVSSYIEKKNGLNYVSWAYAWALVKQNYPNATYTIYENASGCFYHTDGKTCWVKTGVTIEGIEHIEYLPVMDNRNNSIPLNQVTSFDVNKAIQRSLTKACARHGLGLKVYAGEDLPVEGEEAPRNAPQSAPVQQARNINQYQANAPQRQVYNQNDPASERQKTLIADLLIQKHVSLAQFGVNDLELLNKQQASNIIGKLQAIQMEKPKKDDMPFSPKEDDLPF